MGIKYDYNEDDYIDAYDSYYYNYYYYSTEDDDSAKFRFAANGDKCTNTNGIMSDLKVARKITRWSTCSRDDFNAYIKQTGDSKFCLYSTARPTKKRRCYTKSNNTCTNINNISTFHEFVNC